MFSEPGLAHWCMMYVGEDHRTLCHSLLMSPTCLICSYHTNWSDWEEMEWIDLRARAIILLQPTSISYSRHLIHGVGERIAYCSQVEFTGVPRSLDGFCFLEM